LKRFGGITIVVVLVLIWGGLSRVCADNGVVAAANVVSNGLEMDSARQLRIYKDALLRGASEQSRTDAAIELLLRADKASRGILLEALVSKDNAGARQAVCRGLISCRALGAVIKNRNDFREGLVGILVDEEGVDAQLAAEAMLVFKYREIRDRLEKLVRAGELDRGIRLNVVYALKLRPDKEAMSELIRLLDDGDSEVAGAAENALQDSFGIPVGTDKEVWRTILQDLQRKSPSEIRRERLLQQEVKMRKLEAERALWRGLYLAALDREYEASDETTRGVLLVEKLGSELGAVKLWALDKISRRSSGTVLPAEFGPRLIGLISDEDRTVRLETAKVLSKMSNLNPAQKLLEQFEVEKYDGVRLAIFEALGEACYYAFSPGSEIELAGEVRNKTLELAGRYIIEKDAAKAKKGAEVVRKLLAFEGLETALAEKYLVLVGGRYEKSKVGEGSLRGELLAVMAMLCGRSSYYRLSAIKLFEDAFMEGLVVEDDNAVREAAVGGVINIDKVTALALFKERGLVDDDSDTVRKAVIEVTGEVGDGEDLVWVAEKIGSNGEGELAYQAMREILRRQKASVVAEWAGRLAGGAASDGQMRDLLEMAEDKAVGEKATDILLSVRAALVEIYLAGGDAEKVGRVMTAQLRQNDLGAGDVLVAKVDAYLDSGEVEAEAKARLIGVLEGVEVEGAEGVRVKWTEQVKAWRERL
jgi:HEAT repeat protein